MARGAPFWLALALGGAIMGFGASGLMRSLGGPELASYVRWWLGGLVIHDLLLLPAAAAVGLLLVRLAPARARAPLQLAGYASAAIVLATLPLLIGRGGQAGNESLQPNDYAGNVTLVLSLVWVAGIAVAIVRMRQTP